MCRELLLSQKVKVAIQLKLSWDINVLFIIPTNVHFQLLRNVSSKRTWWRCVELLQTFVRSWEKEGKKNKWNMMFMCNRIWIWYMFSHMWILSTSGMLWTEKLYFFPWLMMARMVNSLGVLTLNTYSLWGFDSYQNHFSRNFFSFFLYEAKMEIGNGFVCLSYLLREEGDGSSWRRNYCFTSTWFMAHI